ncbi:hypothetical protein [Salegentibacter sp. Hel_I_6]|uniref:hypothetical protein n=1 Tax=Salegentibacter sp. Hel_I_6 TaxID=1250278 RepID=UPI0005644E86|nr:hypothetical protein [Salegentibacter sp. Hel_I_6]
MKATDFFNRNNFGLGIFTQFFNRAQLKKKSNSIENLREEIRTPNYLEKVKYLIKQDLLVRYEPKTVEEVLKDLEVKIANKVFTDSHPVKDEEPVTLEEHPKTIVKSLEILTDEKKQEVWKVQNRVPKWFKNTHQINSQILIAYMDLLGDKKSVPIYKLEAACRSIKTFQNNYNQMKSFGERNHAKVFEEAGERITIWEPVRDFVKKEFLKFKKQNNNKKL